jgi:hypothetical protein
VGEIVFYAFLTFYSFGFWEDIFVGLPIIALFALAYFLIGLYLLNADCRPFQASVLFLSVVLLVELLTAFLPKPITCFGYLYLTLNPVLGQLFPELLIVGMPDEPEIWTTIHDCTFFLSAMLPAVLVLAGMYLQRAKLLKKHAPQEEGRLTEAVKKAQDNGQTPPHKSTDIESRFQDEK